MRTMLSFLHKTQRSISRSARGFSRDRHQFMHDWFLALFKDSLVCAHLVTIPRFQAHWNAQDYSACYDLLFQAHRKRISSLLYAINRTDGFGGKPMFEEALCEQTQESLKNAQRQLMGFLQSTSSEQKAKLQQSFEVYDWHMKLKHSLIAYDWVVKTYSTLQATPPMYLSRQMDLPEQIRQPRSVSFFSKAIHGMDDASGLIHDLGTLRLAAGHSLERELVSFNCSAFSHALENSSPEHLRALIPFYQRYPGLMAKAMEPIMGPDIEDIILGDNEERVVLMLSCCSLQNLQELLEMSESFLEDELLGPARVKLIFRAYAEHDKPLPNSLQKNAQIRAIWGEVLREKIMPSSSMKLGM